MEAGLSGGATYRRWLGPESVDVLVSSSGQRFQGEDERIHAFLHALAADRPSCRVHVLDAGQGLHGPTAAAVGQLLLKEPSVSAVYSVGGANAAILSAFDLAGRRCRPFIGHDLDEENLSLLRSGRLTAVLHHDLHHDLHLACLHFVQAQDTLAGAQEMLRSNVEVITPFNLPASVA
jgi:LacI family transcriptional regulator